jgi:predicted glutamine amidotransferase
VSVRFLWRGIVKSGLNQRDGWGLAFYPDGRAVCLIKEPVPSASSPMAEFLKSHDFVGETDSERAYDWMFLPMIQFNDC